MGGFPEIEIGTEKRNLAKRFAGAPPACRACSASGGSKWSGNARNTLLFASDNSQRGAHHAAQVGSGVCSVSLTLQSGGSTLGKQIEDLLGIMDFETSNLLFEFDECRATFLSHHYFTLF